MISSLEKRQTPWDAIYFDRHEERDSREIKNLMFFSIEIALSRDNPAEEACEHRQKKY